MAKIDEVKEEITLFRSLLITMIVVMISLIGWIAQHIDSKMTILAFLTILFLAIGDYLVI